MMISASQFKARCLALIDDVSEGGGELVITKRGKPVAKLVPVESANLRGTVTYLVDDEALIESLPEVWDAERS